MAQQRRKARELQRRQRLSTLLCIAGGLGAVLLSLIVCLLIFDIGPQAASVSAPVATALPYNASDPFTLADLTLDQQKQVRENGRLSVSDGPRGISIGDTLDTLLNHFPLTFMQEQPEDVQILYCAEYFENQNGIMTALPPRGLLTTGSDAITVTLMAPTSPYPAGTLDNYGEYEHVYCVFTIKLDTMTISSIVLGMGH